MNIINRKNLYLGISLLLLIVGLVAIGVYGLRYGIDFAGGSRLELSSKAEIPPQKIEDVLNNNNIEEYTITTEDNKEFSLRLQPINEKKKNELVTDLKKQEKSILEKSFETIGPSIGNETKVNALKAILLASVAITLYIAFAFREVSRPVASWKFGISAIIALFHDVLMVIGVMAILGHFFGAEIDTLFITALLTIMGFSVHDTIVVFDRVRENLRKSHNIPFGVLVNNALTETVNRSLNTSITVVIVLFAMLLFGGESIRWFVVTLLIGIISGTYSSLFIASPLLVLWNEFDEKRRKKSI